MRIVIDLQAAQSTLRYERPGRDALSLALALVRQRGAHEVLIALNGAFAASIEPLRAAFSRLPGPVRIVVWHTPAAIAAQLPDNHARRLSAECLREAFLAALAPDLVLIGNLFDGFGDDAVASIATLDAGAPVAVLLHERQALEAGIDGAATDVWQRFYQEKAAELAQAHACVALSPQAIDDAGAPGDAIALFDVSQSWDERAVRLIATLEGMAAAGPAGGPSADTIVKRLLDVLPPLLGPRPDETSLRRMAYLLSRLPGASEPRQLLVDVSELVQRDARTGVQRVTRSILRHLLDAPPGGYQVMPVYAIAGRPGYWYAHQFLAGLEGGEAPGPDRPADIASGDVFLGLDLQPVVVPAQKAYLEGLHRDGVRIVFVVYDLLPVLMPRHFPEGTEAGHRNWLDAVCAFDGAVCISRTVALELATWQRQNCPPRLRPLQISWFHLGADVDSSIPSRGMPANAAEILQRLAASSTFVTVGTVEPRKQHAQILGAFELLWRAGVDANLVIVGKQGWMVEHLAQRLRQHPQLGKRLFWLEGVSDQYLEQIYRHADALIVASVGEGFGLPLIEAAQHGIAIIVRDLPVFIEVAGAHAFYFSGSQPAELADAVIEWLSQHAAGRTPSSAAMPWIGWAESTRQLLQAVLPEQAGSAFRVAAPATEAGRPPCVMLVAPYPVRRPRHGGQLRTAAMAQAYRQAGYAVHSVGFYQSDAYGADDLDLHDVAFPAASPFRVYRGAQIGALSDFLMGSFAVGDDDAFRLVQRDLPEQVDVIQFEQPWLYGLARRLQLEMPQCCHALLVCSSQNIEEAMKQGILAASAGIDADVARAAVADIAAIEREAARESQLCLAVTEDDARVLRSYGAAHVMHAPNGISPWHADAERVMAWRTRLPFAPWAIFIASAHPPNYTGFLDAVGDTLACIPSGSRLVIVGGVGPHLERALAASPSATLNMMRIQVLGILDDADLAAVKSLAHVFLLPIGAGGGSNIKTAEALYSARPVICTSTALRGFEQFRDLPEVTVADTPAQFQEAIGRALAAPASPAQLPGGMRASLTWQASLERVPQQVSYLLEQREGQP